MRNARSDSGGAVRDEVNVLLKGPRGGRHDHEVCFFCLCVFVLFAMMMRTLRFKHFKKKNNSKETTTATGKGS